ncbi:sensor histidine kinase [Desulfuribacillus alkaliarsenatis]|uniref:histidine kinase n=1 Tax=Desulfuribacillus alkaliarsenatis TaxID=766136 RepID=A0A1E5G1D2_9FIRM|nr:HAMP domain-containing sensor histidine kinase [Desulfuribacillus alkaliarsenatis]OEF96717.1 hypothetical protein BHF68_06490 [Desulfuribacillus alkaliarsenatis]
MKLSSKAIKTSIQTKLILAFLAVIVVPIVTTAGSMWLLVGQMQNQYDMEQLESLQYINIELRDAITASYTELINQPELFATEIAGVLEHYEIDVQIYAEDGSLLFDSFERLNNAAIDTEARDERFGGLIDNFSQSTMTVQVNYDTNVHVIVYFSPTSMPSQIMVGFAKVLGASLLFGFISLVLAIGGFTWFISRSILRPLSELNRATERITDGDFDFTMNYHKDNEFGRLVKAFQLMKDRLKESIDKQAEQERLRKELVANISHDIRTPVASIKGYVEGIQDGIANNQQQLDKYLSVIHDKTDQLDRLVDDLYKYSQLEVGKMDVILNEYQLDEFFNSILAQFEMQFAADTLELTIEAKASDGYLRADKQRILQVMENVVNNARRYIDDKTGKIEIKVEQADTAFLLVSIKDNGRGIAEEDLPYVFDQFYRGEKSRSRQFGGTGLGLSISKYIIDAHGGKMWIESRLGQGTTVHFTLPVFLKP